MLYLRKVVVCHKCAKVGQGVKTIVGHGEMVCRDIWDGGGRLIKYLATAQSMKVIIG
jgi:hypothetical protein